MDQPTETVIMTECSHDDSVAHEVLAHSSERSIVWMFSTA
jgi:hypothetical protein